LVNNRLFSGILMDLLPVKYLLSTDYLLIHYLFLYLEYIALPKAG